MFTCMTKMNVFTHFFLEILHFKEFCNLIGKQHFGTKLKNQNFVRYGIGVEISITTLFFVLDYIHEKLMTKFFKNSRKP